MRQGVPWRQRRVKKTVSIWCALLSVIGAVGAQESAFVVKTEFIADPPMTPSCHASTILESKDVLLAAWFGGTEEGARDVGIWLSRDEGKGWSQPEEVANGKHDDVRIQYPCWNPVLFRRSNGMVMLFYKEGSSPSTWWGMVKTSDDNGRTWSKARRLPDNILGPIKNKPIELEDGTILSGSSTEDHGWRVFMERSREPFRSWARSEPLNRAIDFAAIQPTILQHPNGALQILCRTKSGFITESWSLDNGYKWDRMRATTLPNPNAGFDAVMLKDKRVLLVYNHAKRGRGLLNVATSPDGRQWFAAGVLENTPGAEFSYPAVIQSPDRMVHVTYTWKRQRIKHVVLDPAKIPSTQEIMDGVWPGE
jgi:predicted neuraminidase